MKKSILFVALFLNFLSLFAQEKNPIAKGFITITTGQKIQFKNLRYEDKIIIFTNIETKSEFRYFENTIKLIEDADHNIIYENKNLPKKVLSQEQLNQEKNKNDTLFKPNYPEGIYEKKEDFINKKPSEVIKLYAKGLYGFEKPILTEITHNCFFYDDVTDSKIKDVFAVSYQGHLYFQINGILNNRNKSDNAQTNDFPNSFVRVIMGGENYFYTEANLTNLWAQGLAYGAIGGVAGVVVASNIIYGKGVVWDFKNKEFNIFKNCQDYNEFAQQIYPSGIQDCPNQQPDVLQIRKVMKKIK